jgi:hypothetical protein
LDDVAKYELNDRRKTFENETYKAEVEKLTKKVHEYEHDDNRMLIKEDDRPLVRLLTEFRKAQEEKKDDPDLQLKLTTRLFEYLGDITKEDYTQTIREYYNKVSKNVSNMSVPS